METVMGVKEEGIRETGGLVEGKEQSKKDESWGSVVTNDQDISVLVH